MTTPQTFLGRPVVEVDMSEEIEKLGPITLIPLTKELAAKVMKDMFDHQNSATSKSRMMKIRQWREGRD